MSSNKKTNLSWRRFLAIPGVFPYPLLVFHNAVSTVFLLLWWNSHNGRYWLLYFLNVYPPSRVCYCRTEGYAGQGATLSLQNLNIFFLIILNSAGSIGVGGADKVQGVSGRLLVGLMQSARSPGLLRVCERWAVPLELFGHKGYRYAVWSARAR